MAPLAPMAPMAPLAPLAPLAPTARDPQGAIHEGAPGQEPAGWLLIVAVAAVALTGLFHVGGSDIWWHIRTGQWMWENGSLMTEDPFSHTAEGPVRYTEALSQLFFYWVHRIGGVGGLVWAKVALLAAIAWLVSRLTRSDVTSTAIAVGLWGAASGFRFVVKPHLFSFLAFAAVLAVALRAEQRREPRLLWWIPLVMLFWGNLHRGGMIGLVLLGCLAAGWAVNARTRPMVKHAAAVLVASAVALTANSAGVGYLTSAFDLSRNQVFSRYLAEWSQLTPLKLLFAFPAFAVMLTFWSIGWFGRRRRLDAGTLLVAATLLLAIRGVRFIPYCAMAMVPALAEDLEVWLARLKEKTGGAVRGPLLDYLAVAAVAGLLFAGMASRRPPHLRGPGIDTQRVPVEAADWLRRHPPPGRMWNSFNFGGYLLWALAPEIPVSIDGRNDTVYETSFFERSLLASIDPDELARQVEEFSIGFAVVDVSGPGDTHYRNLHRDWRLVYWDDAVAILVKPSAEASGYLERYGYRELAVGTVHERLARWISDPEREALAREILANVERAPRSITARQLAANVHGLRGDRGAFLAQFEAARRLAAERGIDLKLAPPPGAGSAGP